ncbi:MAG: AEC family transporter [Lachnospiraceae bacterium]|nr:AEC family transporter [Lachnospiraceae bacterium]
MDTLMIVAPVLVMIIIGMACDKWQIISQAGVDNIKKFITTIALPVCVFHAVSTATYNKNVVVVLLLMLIVAVVGFVAGFTLKGLVKEPYRKYFPYLMTIYEGGMMAYPLYQSLMGVENMSNIALIDVSCGIFAFGIYFGMLTMTDQGIKPSGKQLAKNAFSSPIFVALLVGLLVGVIGIMNSFVSTDVGQIYVSIKDMVTAPVSAMILLCVGYEFKLEKGNIGVCIKTVIIRFVVQAIMLVGVLFVAKAFEFDKPMVIGLALYMMTIPSLCLSSFVKDKEAGKYFSTTSSLYLIVNLVAYVVLAGMV